MKLSVIIPIYNPPEHLFSDCLKSLLNQDATDATELVFVDDGSTQPFAAQAVKQAIAAHPERRISYIRKENSGVSDTRNAGIEAAVGDYVMFIDHDDVIEPDTFRRAMSLTDSTQADMVMLGAVCNFGKPLATEAVQRHLTDEERAGMRREIITNEVSPWESLDIKIGWTRHVYSRRMIEEHAIGFVSGLSPVEDSLFNLHCMTHARSVYVDNRIAYHFIVNGASVSHRYSDGIIRITPVVMQQFESYLNQHEPCRATAAHLLAQRAFYMLRCAKEQYFCHPDNPKSFRQLRAELRQYLHTPALREHIGRIRLGDARNRTDTKNIVLYKLGLYWIYLLTERRRRRQQAGSGT